MNTTTMNNTTINTQSIENLRELFRDYVPKRNRNTEGSDQIMIMVYPNVKDKINGKRVPVKEVIKNIRNKPERQQVSDKINLTVGYFSASGFTGSTCDKNVTKHTGLIIIDIDKKDNPGTDFNDLKSILAEDRYTYVSFTSPSGGLKLIVNTNIDTIEHHDAFYESIRQYLLSHYKQIKKIDTSGSNVSRACYLPYDANAYFNPHAFRYSLSKEQIEEILTEININKHRNSLPKVLLQLEYISYDEHYDNLLNLIKKQTSMGQRVLNDNGENQTTVGLSEENNKENQTTMGLSIEINQEKRTEVGLYDNIFNKYRYINIEQGVMSTDVPFFEFLVLKNIYSQRLDFTTRLDEYYFKSNPQKPISTDSIEGLDGMEVCQIVLPKNGIIKMGSRGKTLQSITVKLIYNNPFCHPQYILKTVKAINDYFCEDPNPINNPKPDDTEVEKIVCSCYNLFINGELDFRKAIRKKVNKEKVSKKYVFRSKQYLSFDRSITHLESVRTFSEGRRAKNLRKYEQAINSLQDGKKITKKRIAEYMGMSARNISRYETDKYDDLIKKYNKALKTNKLSCKTG